MILTTYPFTYIPPYIYISHPNPHFLYKFNLSNLPTKLEHYVQSILNKYAYNNVTSNNSNNSNFSNVEEYIDFLVKHYDSEFKKFQSKEFLVLCSGGKDSMLSLYIIHVLSQIYNFHYTSYFVYLPFFEDLVYFESKKLLEKFNVKVVRVQDNIILSKLTKLGLPHKFKRWCTACKFSAIKTIIKFNNDYIVVEGIRVYEGTLRAERLANKQTITQRHFRPILYLSDLEVFKFTKKLGLLNPMYQYSTRTSCTYCPFAPSVYISLRLHHYSNKIPERFKIFINVVKSAFQRWKRLYSVNLPVNEIQYLTMFSRMSGKTATKFHNVYMDLIEYSEEVPVTEFQNLHQKLYLTQFN